MLLLYPDLNLIQLVAVALVLLHLLPPEGQAVHLHLDLLHFVVLLVAVAAHKTALLQVELDLEVLLIYRVEVVLLLLAEGVFRNVD
jgi:hypothetical protein